MNTDTNQMLRRLVGLRLLMNRPLTPDDPPISLDDEGAAPDAAYNPWTPEDQLKQLVARTLLTGSPPSGGAMPTGAAPQPILPGAAANFGVAAGPNSQQPTQAQGSAITPFNPWTKEDQLKQLIAQRLLSGRPPSVDDVPVPQSLKISPDAAATSPPTDRSGLMEMRRSPPDAATNVAGQAAPGAATAPAVDPNAQARLRARAETYLQDPNVRAFLNTIGYAEGADYNSLYGSPPKTFNNFGAFPGRGLPNTPSGKYQILESTYDGLARELGLSDFSPHTQDLMAAQLLIENSAMPWVLNGNFDQAIANAAGQWGGLPQGPIRPNQMRGIDENPRQGQHPKPYADVLKRYNAEIGR